jgi:hypothetical protein
MKGRRRSDKSVEPFVVTVADGTKFRCSIAALGRETEPRWVLLDSDGVQYIGPPVEADKSPEAVERRVSAWWEDLKATRGSPAESQAKPPTESAGVNAENKPSR